MSFEEIRGQRRAIRILQNEVAAGSISGAYLFIGPDGVGKNLTALNFAKVLNCKEGKIDSCDRCSSCRKIDRLSHPDLRIIEPREDSIKIEQIRTLKREVAYSLYEGKKKVWIIRDADKFTQEAANSLLKILEEPPPQVVIILISQTQEKLLPTITSRCETIPFSPLSSSEIRQILKKYLPPTSPRAHLVEKLARGRVGEAILLLEDEDILNLREKVLNSLEENLNLEQIFQLAGSWKNFPPHQLERILDMILFWFRDLLILKYGGGERIINHDRMDRLRRQGNRYSSSGLSKAIETVEATKRHLTYRVNAALAL
ncbi:DNA polymerase III subunit delta', partial [Candidatus Aerophobetes bacterium]